MSYFSKMFPTPGQRERLSKKEGLMIRCMVDIETPKWYEKMLCQRLNT